MAFAKKSIILDDEHLQHLVDNRFMFPEQASAYRNKFPAPVKQQKTEDKKEQKTDHVSTKPLI